jgi:hypothetical protein
VSEVGLALLLIGVGAFVTSLGLARSLAYLDGHPERLWPHRSMILEVGVGLLLFVLGILEGGGVV